MAASPVGRAFTLGATRRATELRERDGHGFGDVLAAKLPAAAVALIRKAKDPATIVINAEGAELKVGDKTFWLGLDKHEAAHDCYRENVRSRRWDDLGPIRHSLQPTRKRTRDMTTRIERAPGDRPFRTKDPGAAARAMLGNSGLASVDSDSDSHDEAATVGGDAMPTWTPSAEEPLSARPRRGPGAARLDRAVSAVVAGGRGRAGRGRGRGKTLEAKGPVIISAARTALQARVLEDRPDVCDALSGVRAYNRAVAEVTAKHALQMELDAELAAVAAHYSMLSDTLAVAQASTGAKQSAEVASIRSRMAAWERANANAVRTKLQMYEMVRKELLSLKSEIGKLADKQNQDKAVRLRQANEAASATGDAPVRGRGRSRPRGRGGGRVGRPRGSRKATSTSIRSTNSQPTGSVPRSEADAVGARPSKSDAAANPRAKEKSRRKSSKVPATAGEETAAACTATVTTSAADDFVATEAARAGARGIAEANFAVEAKKAERMTAAARSVPATEPAATPSAATPSAATPSAGVHDVALEPSASQWASIDMGFEVTE